MVKKVPYTPLTILLQIIVKNFEKSTSIFRVQKQICLALPFPSVTLALHTHPSAIIPYLDPPTKNHCPQNHPDPLSPALHAAHSGDTQARVAGSVSAPELPPLPPLS